MNKFPRIIAICGLKRSGKDTIADYLCNNHNYIKVKIASPLKEGIKSIFGFTDDQLETDLKDVKDARWGVEPRKIMQHFGTEVMQYQLQELIPNIGRSFWIKRLIDEHIVNSKEQRIVIPDLRFKHEYDMLKQYGAIFWRVERDIGVKHECQHLSEREYLDIPVSAVYKNDTKIDLYFQVEKQILNISQN